jgi:hypothetical protein
MAGVVAERHEHEMFEAGGARRVDQRELPAAVDRLDGIARLACERR